MPRTSLLILLSSVLLSPLHAAAAPPPLASLGGASTAHQGSDCPGLFGDERSRTLNASTRATRIHWIDSEEEGVTLATSHDAWLEPTPLRVRGLQLVAVRGFVAEFALAPTVARHLSCPAGRYLLRVDDSIGRRSAILTVTERGVLVERRGRLRFIKAPHAALPRWLLAWRVR